VAWPAQTHRPPHGRADSASWLPEMRTRKPELQLSFPASCQHRERSRGVREAHPPLGRTLRCNTASQRERLMNYVFWLIGVIVVILVVLGFLGLR